MRVLFQCAVTVVGLTMMMAFCGPVAAHETTRSYVNLQRNGAEVHARFRVAFRDVEVAVWMDEDLDGLITLGEVRRRQDAVVAFLQSGFSLDAGGRCALTSEDSDTSRDGGIDYFNLDLAGACPDPTAPLSVSSRLFHDIDPDHRMFLSAVVGGVTTTTVLSRTDPEIEISGESGGPAAALWSYFKAGVEHLLAGADHIVFLLVLMLPAISVAQGQARKAATGVLTAITGFTFAHALTLTAATTDLLRPPSDLINTLIAVSIIVTAIDNVRPFIPAPRTTVAAFFGIIHGFGFATALGALQLTTGGLVVALVGFNIGIEVAQVGIVLVTMPALYMLGGGRVLLWIGSAGAGAIGFCWLWERLAFLA